MLSLTDAEAGKPGGITLGSVDKPHPKCDEACMYLCQMRELTDKEIEEVFYELDVGHSATEFARAILRKAQGD